MVDEIRLYVEGGGDGKDTKDQVRRGFAVFLRNIVEIARGKRIRWRIVACGSRNSTLGDFKTGIRAHPHAFNVLLVDAEAPVAVDPRQHLQNRDGWDLTGIADDQCHLMAQVNEAWLVADVDALEKYYGPGFHSNSIPRTNDVEQIDKTALYSALKAASRDTSKGEYHKVRHAPAILARLDVSKVRNRAHHCNRLFATLEAKVNR